MQVCHQISYTLINPHITDPGVDKSFPDLAKEKLRNYPIIGEFARALDKSIK